MRRVEWEGGVCSCGNMEVRTGFVKGLKMRALIQSLERTSGAAI
jgi:hypothetical protein